MSNQKDDLPKKIEEWLENQGYPLEMAVAAAFQKAGFTVGLSDIYEDFETSETREIDVTAIRWSETQKPVWLQIACRIECKLAKDKPWIVFVSQAQPESFTPLKLICSQVYQAFLLQAFEDPEFLSTVKEISLLTPIHVGHGVTQAFTSGLDIPYKALTSAMKASVDRAVQFDSLNARNSNASSSLFVAIVLPAIVIDGKLFECFLAGDGHVTVNEVESSVIYWKGSNPINTTSYIHIVTKPALERFVEQVNQAATKLIDFSVPRMKGYIPGWKAL